jgi:hypothetical protein
VEGIKLRGKENRNKNLNPQFKLGMKKKIIKCVAIFGFLVVLWFSRK